MVAGDAPQGEWLGSSRNSALRDEDEGESSESSVVQVWLMAHLVDNSDRLSLCEPW